MNQESIINYWKDWLNWYNWFTIVFVITEFINYYDTFIRWKWGYYSIDLIPAFILLTINIFVIQYVLQERRWKEFRKLKAIYYLERRETKDSGGAKNG